ncbi:alpha-hydroxy-acid oxidizing enzyme [Rhodobacteraceae bacterium WD3A24]|nr:alpha-hydroxy-acid oxidizing enzyme [Rhodobacteraceae bacterium WD3A24]
MDLDLTHPALSDLRATCRRRLPHFVWEYLDSATGTEAGKRRNRAGLDAVTFRPAALRGEIEPRLDTALLGVDHAAPFGIAPLGMSGLIWPRAETILAGFAARARIPYGLSTVATRLPEEVGPLSGEMGWFQLYPPRDCEIRRDILRRAREAGFRVLVLTVDVPGPSRRERQRRAQLAIPPKLTPKMMMQMARHPRWSIGTALAGPPRLRLMEEYLKLDSNAPSTAHAGYMLRTAPDWAYLDALRAEWDGPLVVKGVMESDTATRARDAGVDAVWVSNHSGRQFDGAPAAIEALPGIRAALGPETPLIFDSGVEGGLDILRAMALGADFVMLGRAWHYALGALGAKGPDHLMHILREDLISCMTQIGIAEPGAARERLVTPAPV